MASEPEDMLAEFQVSRLQGERTSLRMQPLCRLLCLVLPFFANARWLQDRFAISIWVDPVVPAADFDSRYAQMANANFTVLLGGFGATTNETVPAQLAACERNGLKAIVSTCGGSSASNPGSCVNTANNSTSAFWGYQVYCTTSTRYHA